MSKSSLLEIEELNVKFSSPLGTVHALKNVSFSVEKGSILGVVGESGTQATLRQSKLFAPIILVLIFTEALALYGLIVGMILSQQGQRLFVDVMV